MIKVDIEGIEFELAEEWQEITFSQYIDLININKDEGLQDLERAIEIISYLSNKPIECRASLYKLSKGDFEELASYFKWTNDPIENYKSDKEFLEIDGKKYKIKKDYNKLTIGEMISVETLMANNKNLDPLEVAFGVLLRELDSDGNEKEFSEERFIHVLTKLKEKVMLLDVYQYINFFLSGAQISTKSNSKGFSVLQTKKTTSPQE